MRNGNGNGVPLGGMIGGQLNIQGFNYEVADCEGENRLTGKTQPIKLLILKSNSMPFAICFPMSLSEYDQFVSHLTERKLILPNTSPILASPEDVARISGSKVPVN